MAEISATDASKRFADVQRGVERERADCTERHADIVARLRSMYPSYIMRRTQIYIGEEQDRLLGARADATGTTKSALIRDAIELLLADESDARGAGLQRLRSAVAVASGIAPYLPAGHDYAERVRAPDAERQRELGRTSRASHGGIGIVDLR